MVATIRKRKTKKGERRYQVVIRRRGAHEVGTFGSLEAAQAWARRKETGLDLQRIDGFAPRTLAEAVERYIKREIEQHAEGDRDNVRQRLGWWTDRLGDLPLRDLTPARLSETWDQVQGSPGTRNRYLAVLSKVLTTATKEWQWMPANPCLSLKRRREGPGRVRMLSPEERKKLLAACRTQVSGPKLYAMVLFALDTGCRLGEIERLLHKHVRIDQEEAFIERSKNGDARTVFLSPDLAAALDHVPPRHDGLVFGPLPMKGWRKARAAAGLGDWRFHDLRHAFASDLAGSAISVPQIASALGHRTWAMARRYSHHLEDAAKTTMREYHAKAAARRATAANAPDERTPDHQEQGG